MICIACRQQPPVTACLVLLCETFVPDPGGVPYASREFVYAPSVTCFVLFATLWGCFIVGVNVKSGGAEGVRGGAA